jgi:hypothetical protein
MIRRAAYEVQVLEVFWTYEYGQVIAGGPV